MEELKVQLEDNRVTIKKLDAQLDEIIIAYPDILNRPQVIKDEIKKKEDRIARLESHNIQLTQEIAQAAAAAAAAAQATNPGLQILNQILQNQEETKADVKRIKRKQQEADWAKLDVWSESKRTKIEQQAFKTELINSYQRQDPNNPNNLLCMVLNKSLPKHEVIASHIYKHAFPTHLDAFGIDRAEINNPRNGLLLAKKIKEAFDVKHVCFLYNPITQQFTFRVLNPALLRDPITQLPVQIHPSYPDTFASLDNQPLQLLQAPAVHPNLPVPQVFPWKRLLGFHARCSYRFARQLQWITAAQHDQFIQHEQFVLASQGAVDPEEDDD